MAKSRVKKSDETYRAAVFGMKGLIRILILVLAVVALVYLAKFCYGFGYAIFNETAMAESPGEEVTVVIPEDASAWEISGILKDAGLIGDRLVFVAQERLSAYHDRLGSGTFYLNTSYLPTQILAALAGEEVGAE